MTASPPLQPRNMTIAGWTLSGLFLAFMAMDVTIKLIRLPIVAETMTGLGWKPEMGFTIGVIEAVAVILYAIPRTAVLGAVLMTAVLGGAVATHVRIDSPLFSHILFGVYLGLFMWGGLFLRMPALRDVFPVRRG